MLDTTTALAKPKAARDHHTRQEPVSSNDLVGQRPPRCAGRPRASSFAAGHHLLRRDGLEHAEPPRATTCDARLPSGAPRAGFTLAHAKTRAHFFCHGTTSAGGTTGRKPRPVMLARQPRSAKSRSQSTRPLPAPQPLPLDVVSPRRSPRNHLGGSTGPATQPPHWLARNHLGPPRYHRLAPRRPPAESRPQPRGPAQAARRSPLEQPR
jgi:hypothetical protein